MQNEKHLISSDYLNQFEGIIAILKTLQDLTSARSTPGFQLQVKLSCTKCLVILLPDVVPNAQTRALKKKWKSDLNPRCGPVTANV